MDGPRSTFPGDRPFLPSFGPGPGFCRRLRSSTSTRCRRLELGPVFPGFVMLKRFQSNCSSSDPETAPARWRLDPNDVLLLNRIEQATLSTIVSGCSPAQTRSAIVACLRGVELNVTGLESSIRHALPRLMEAVRAAASARLDAELIAAVCSDAMDVGQMLRAAYCEGLDAGRALRSAPAVVQ